MPLQKTRENLEAWYDHWAQVYLRQLTTEEIMEAVEQATQRKITVVSGDLIRVFRPDVQTFSELLLQYPDPNGSERKPRQVVPDNSIMVHEKPLDVHGSYNIELQPVKPFVVIEYVSKNSTRKDYEDNMEKYDRHLQVPYYLLFYPDNQELTLYRHNGERYVTVLPNEHGRYAIPELEVEVAILDEWMRYWFRGELLPLPAEMQAELIAARREATEAKQRAEKEALRADAEADRAEKAAQEAKSERDARLALEAEVQKLKALLQQRGGELSP